MDLPLPGDVERVGQEVGVAVLGGVRRVQRPELGGHRAEVVQTGL